MKSKRSKQELTRLILTALILGSGCLYGTVAEATEVTVNSSSTPVGATTGGSGSGSSSTRYLTIENGEENDILNIDYAGTHWQDYAFYGGYKYSPGHDVKNRTVNLISGSVRQVVGGWNGSGTGGGAAGGDANYNTVNITGGTITDSVYGGYAVYRYNASHNTITIGGSGTLNLEAADIYGGHPGDNSTSYKAEYNTININRSVTVKSLQGGAQTWSNNTLNIGATNVKAQKFNNNDGFVQGFDNINIGYVIKEGGQIKENHEINFSDSTTPVLSAAEFLSNPTVNITGLKNQSTDSGTMTLLSSGTANNFANYKVVYGTGANDYVQFSNSTTNPVTSKSYGGTDATNSGKGVTLNYKTGGKTLSLYDSAKQIRYTIGNTPVHTVTLAGMAWNDGYTTPSGLTFNGNSSGKTTVNATNLTFSDNPFNFGTTNPLGTTKASMTLLANATSINGEITQPGTNKGTLNASFSTNGVAFTGVAKGEVSAGSNAIKYTLNSGNLNTVALGGWTGTTASLTGWQKGTANVAVSGSISDAAKTVVGEGNYRDIVSADYDLFSTATGLVYNTTAFSKNLATGVDISGDKGTGVKASTDGKSLTYYNGAEDKANMTGVTLGAMTWGQDTASTTDYSFKNTATIDATNLSFSATNALIAKDTKKTLLSASGLGGNTINGNTDKTFEIVNGTDSNGLKYNATAKGKVETETGKVNFKVNEVTLNTLNLSGWNGTGTSSLLSGWTKNTSGVSVVGVFTKPSLAAGGTRNIITTGTDNFFSDNNIAEDIKYKTGDDFSDEVAGVTLSGKKAGGVKATNNGQDLTFYAERNEVKTDATHKGIALGTMTWGTARAATTAYDFSGVTSIDASSLGFTGTAKLNTLTNASTDLLTGATGLTADTILNGTNKIFDIEYTNATTGITYFGKATTGAVSRDGTTLKYTISGGELDTINLSTWDPTGGAGDIPDGWTPPSGGVAVDTGNFNTPGGTDNVDIFTTDEDDFFNEENITGDKKYKDHEKMPDDPQGGVTISGNKTGGIAPSNDGQTPTTSGKKLTYFAEYTTGTGISLGEVAWNKDGTARTLTGNYTFSDLGNNGVDATNLKFTFTGDGANTIKAYDTMTLLAGATGLNADLTVKGSPVSQSISYSGLANKVGLTGTLTGNVTTTPGAVNYKVASKTLDSVNLSNWNGSNENLDESWTNNASGIKVSGSGFTAPTAIGDTPILTAGSNGFFTNAIIADNIKFQPSGAYSETDKNITLSGNRGSGVKANDDGDKLVYSIGAAFINNVKLGTVDYTENGTWITKSDTSKYNFSNLSSLDTTGFVMSMTEAQRKSAAVNDTMTLIAGNNTMGDIAAKDAGIINYSYDAKPGSITVGGTVTGSVSASGNNVLYTVKDNTATTLDFTTVKWGETYARSGSDLNFSNAVVNSSNIFFTGVTSLKTTDAPMTLISNYGGGINKTRAGIFTVDDGNGNILKGKGVAYYDTGSDSLMYKVTLGAGETQETVTATNNKAILIVPDGDKHPGTVTGGEAKGDGDSTDNEQKVKGKIITDPDGTGGDVNGGTSEEGDSKRNKADVEDSTIAGDVNGGKSDNGNSTDNEADVDNSTVHGDVNGGDTNGDGGTKGNRTNVKHGSVVKGNVNGGHSGGNGDSTGNEANVDDSTVDHDVNGGYSEGSGNANENKTTVSGSTIGGGVNGGHSGTGSTNKNETTVSDSTVTGDVTGGRNEGDGTANENRTTVSGSNVGGDVIGGQSKNGNTNQNEVSVSGGSVGGEVIGGKTENGSSSNNNVTISGNTDVNGKVYGGYSENGSASGNTVTIKNASVRDYVYGGKSKSQSSNNSVLFEPGKALGIIGGGCEVSTNNTAELREGTVDEHVIGGFATATATSNTATVVGGTVTGSVIGGYGGTTAADNNTVNLGGGTVTGNTITSATLGVTIDGGVYGGYSVSGTTQNNTVNIFGSADVSNTGLFGGNLQYNGNVLNIGYNNTPWTGGGQSVKDIKNFESMNFSIVPWSTTQSGVTISNGGSSDLSMTTVSAKEVAFTGVKSLAVNDTMTLLDQSAVDGAKQATNVVENSKYTLGTVQEGTGTLTKDANGNVLYQVETASVSKQTHNTVMAAEAALVSINAGNDFINSATDGLARDENMGKDGMATYAKIGGQSLEHETGSHVNVNTWNAILAVGHKNVKKKSTFEYGAFVEHGRGNFTTHNDGLRGDGSVDYTGGGLLAKWKTNKGTYVEGSFRAGSVHEKANNLLRDAVQGYGYDERTNYMGFHIGVGKETVLKNGNVLDFYGKYFYNRKNGMDFNAGIDEYNLDAVTSQVLRVGTRYTVKSGSRWNYYGDLSYEYEFDGMATGRANGMAIRGADISGGSVRLELGASLVPNDESPWNVDFNLTAYAGNKSGFTGGVSVKYAF